MPTKQKKAVEFTEADVRWIGKTKIAQAKQVLAKLSREDQSTLVAMACSTAPSLEPLLYANEATSLSASTNLFGTLLSQALLRLQDERFKCWKASGGKIEEAPPLIRHQSYFGRHNHKAMSARA